MCSSISSSSLSLNSRNLFFYRHTFDFSSPVNPFRSTRPLKSKPLSLTPSISNRNPTPELSSSKAYTEEYNGWAIDELDSNPPQAKKKSLPAFVVTGIGASVTVLLGLIIAYFSISSKGFKFRLRSPLDALHGYRLTFLADKKDIESEVVSTDVPVEDAQVPVDDLDGLLEAQVEEKSLHTMKERTERVIVPLAADHTQEEAMLVLKKLKIIEDDARSDELCTRRQYARWLLLTNSLERSRKHRIIPSAALSGSGVTAFDDVQIEDPDFEHIQSLAESGVIRSKLSIEKSDLKSDDVEVKEHVNFSPERFISREDLVNWKAKIEYQVMPGITEQMSRKNIGFLDVKAISPDVLVDLFMDVLADEKSILRAVFGQSKRLQPSKPCTKGQAAVALTRGRMAEFIQAELLKQETEIVSKQIEVEEILKEFLERGEIRQFWERKMEDEKKHGFKVDMDYQVAIDALEQEKITQENASAELVKQWAALDCQRQLLSRLGTEVDDMSEKVAFEKANCIHERHGVEDVLRELLVNYEELLDKKSVLEAEVEALRKLRSWVEDEATKSQARAKVLEEAARRWKWVA